MEQKFFEGYNLWVKETAPPQQTRIIKCIGFNAFKLKIEGTPLSDEITLEIRLGGEIFTTEAKVIIRNKDSYELEMKSPPTKFKALLADLSFVD